MQIVTPQQMRRLEERSEKLGVTKKQLMENAGRKLAELINSYCRNEAGLPPEECSVVFLAGTGNNGGDCFAAADILVYKGYRITVIHIGGLPKTLLAQEMLGRLPKERISFIEGFTSDSVKAAIEAAELDYMTIQPASGNEHTPLDGILSAEKHRMETIKSAVIGAQVLVDGVFGTGFHGSLEKDIMGIFGIETYAYRIAVDVPSGGDSSTGNVSKGVFKADETLTFGFIKTGMSQYPLKKYCGKVTVADIGHFEHAVDLADVGDIVCIGTLDEVEVAASRAFLQELVVVPLAVVAQLQGVELEFVRNKAQLRADAEGGSVHVVVHIGDAVKQIVVCCSYKVTQH